MTTNAGTDVFRTALPDADYLVAAGRAQFVLQSTEWTVIEVIGLLDPTADLTVLVAGMMSAISTRLDKAIEQATGLSAPQVATLKALAQRFNDLVSRRNDIAHSRPATDPNTNRPVMYRWSPKHGRAEVLDLAFLNSLAMDADKINIELLDCRSWLP